MFQFFFTNVTFHLFLFHLFIRLAYFYAKFFINAIVHRICLLLCIYNFRRAASAIQMQLDASIHIYTNITLKLINYMWPQRAFMPPCVFFWLTISFTLSLNVTIYIYIYCGRLLVRDAVQSGTIKALWIFSLARYGTSALHQRKSRHTFSLLAHFSIVFFLFFLLTWHSRIVYNVSHIITVWCVGGCEMSIINRGVINYLLRKSIEINWEFARH